MLDARLSALEQATLERSMPRGEAGDRIAEEVVKAAGPPTTPEDRLLLLRAETLRARLYLQSGAKTPLDAATALLYAAEHEATLSPDPDRADVLAPLALAVLERLRPLRSKRRSFRVFMVLTDAAAIRPEAAGGAAAVFELAPAYLDGAKRRFPPRLIGGLLDKLQTALRRDAGVDPDVRDRLQTRLFRWAIEFGDARRGLDYWPGAAFVTPKDSEALALVCAAAPRIDDDLLGAVEHALHLGEDARRRLEKALRDRSRVAQETPDEDLAGLEGLNRRMVAYYGAEAWVWNNLLRCAVRRGRPADAFAAFARLSERAAELDDAPVLVAPLLLKTGFRRLASEFGDAATRLLAQAELTLGTDPRRASDEMLGQLERVFMDDGVPPILRNRAAQLRGRLAYAAGRAEEAVEHLERALSRDHENAELAGDLAEVLAAAGDFRRAAAFVDVALEGGEAPRLLELKAACLEGSGDVALAADRLKRAVDLDGDHAAHASADGRAALVAETERSYARYGADGAPFSPFLARLRADAETAAPAVRRGLERPDAARRRAVHLCDRVGRWRDVLALLAPWRSRLAQDEDLAVLAARAAVGIGRGDEALRLLEPFATDAEPRVRTARGEALAAVGRHAEAAAELEAAGAAGDLERAGAALARLELLRGRPDAALARIATALEDPGLPRAAAAGFLALRAAAYEAKGDALTALGACVESLERFESESARTSFVRIAVTAALECEDKFLRADLLFRAVDGAAGPASGDIVVWASIANLALGRPSELDADEAADKLSDLRLDCGPGGRSRRIVDAWVREQLAAPPSEISLVCTTPEPATAGTDTASGPFE